MRILSPPLKQQRTATVAQVSFSDAAGFGAVGAAEYRGIPVFAPRGIAYRPCEGDNLLILPVDGSDTCVGVLSVNDTNLGGGELRLSSAGGACIHLKNNGDILLNGLTITREGQMIPVSETQHQAEL